MRDSLQNSNYVVLPVYTYTFKAWQEMLCTRGGVRAIARRDVYMSFRPLTNSATETISLCARHLGNLSKALTLEITPHVGLVCTCCVIECCNYINGAHKGMRFPIRLGFLASCRLVCLVRFDSKDKASSNGQLDMLLETLSLLSNRILQTRLYDTEEVKTASCFLFRLGAQRNLGNRSTSIDCRCNVRGRGLLEGPHLHSWCGSGAGSQCWMQRLWGTLECWEQHG